MKYPQIETAVFLRRPNRFIAEVDLAGQQLSVHVPNTGRCKELFQPGVKAVLQKAQNPARRTPYSLVSVYKEQRLVNIDSQAPNKLALEALQNGLLLGFTPETIQKEATFGRSRLDFYYESPAQKEKGYIEVKGVTLEINNTAYFPDAPTERGVRHLQELISAKQQGLQSHVIFVVQMEGVQCFRPNQTMHPAFAETLRQAAAQGVKVAAWGCKVQEGEVTVDHPIPVALD